jgi:hypothetical protein
MLELYLYSPYGPYGLYRASVPVQGCTLPYLLFYLYMLDVNNRVFNELDRMFDRNIVLLSQKGALG